MRLCRWRLVDREGREGNVWERGGGYYSQVGLEGIVGGGGAVERRWSGGAAKKD